MSKSLNEDHFTELIECLRFVEDPRVRGRSQHLLIDILVISICATLCGAEGILEIQLFAQQKEGWLRKFLKLPSGIPSHDTIARVLAMIDVSQAEIAFTEWVQGSLLEQKEINSISLDGKSSNGSERGFNKSRRPLHVVSAYAHGLGLSLAQAESNSSGQAEVEGALECLRVLDISGITVMADAGIGVKSVVHQIREQKGNYIVPVKGNNKHARDEIAECFEAKAKSFKRTKEKGHGRKESRECRTLETTGMSEKFLDKFSDAKTIIEIKRARSEKDKRFVLQTAGADGKITYEINTNELKIMEETTYYVSNLKLTAEEALNEVRKHWQIENNLHWVLDVAFREDDCMVRARRLAKTLSLVRRTALNLIRVSNTKGSVKGRMKKAGWNDQYLELILFGGPF